MSDTVPRTDDRLPRVGTLFGPYRLRRLLGRGGGSMRRRALSALSNVAIDVTACGYRLTGDAGRVADAARPVTNYGCRCCAHVHRCRTPEPIGAQALSVRCWFGKPSYRRPGGTARHRPATPYLSLWGQAADSAPRLDHLLYQNRSAVKHLAMRRTLWLVNADDLALVQSAASDRVADNERRKLVADLQKAGVTADGERWLAQAGAAVLRHLGEHGPATSTELRAALPELAGTYDPAPGKRWGGMVPLAPRVLTTLSARGLVVRGPNDGAWTTSRPRWSAAGHWLTDQSDPHRRRRPELS